MPVNRIGYGYGLFSAGDFGTEGVTHESSASVSVTSTVAVQGGRSITGSATLSATSSVSSPTAIRFRLSGAAVSSNTTTASVAQKFILELSNRYSYGTSAYGTNLYGVDDFEMAVNATSTATASAEIVYLRSATATPTSTSTCSARRVPEGSALIYGTSSTGTSSISTGARIRTGDANPAGDASGSTIAATRVREADSADTSTASGAGSGVFIVSVSSSTSAASSSTGTAACNWISSGSLSASSSSSAQADLVLDSGRALKNIYSTATCYPAATWKDSAAVSSNTVTSAFAGYVQRSSAAVSSTSTIVSIGREKWEVITYSKSSPWTTIAA